MNIEKLVLSIEQMSKLRQLGLDTTDAALCWFKIPFCHICYEVIKMDDNIRHRCKSGADFSDEIPTYTLQEILEKLPPKYRDLIPYNNQLEHAYQLLCWKLEKEKENRIKYIF